MSIRDSSQTSNLQYGTKHAPKEDNKPSSLLNEKENAIIFELIGPQNRVLLFFHLLKYFSYSKVFLDTKHLFYSSRTDLKFESSLLWMEPHVSILRCLFLSPKFRI